MCKNFITRLTTRGDNFSKAVFALLTMAVFAFSGHSCLLLANTPNYVYGNPENLSARFSLNNNEIPIVTAVVTPVSCFDGNNGTATAVAVGIPPFAYAWSTGETTANVSGLAAGTYTVTVTDGLAQTGTATAVILEPLPIEIDLSVSGLLTCIIPSVTVTALATGGNLGLSYQWSNGATGLTMTTDVAADYTVTVTDLLGCTSTDIATVNADINPPNADAGPTLSLTCLLPQIDLDGTDSDNGPLFSLLWTATAGGNIVSGENTTTPTVDAAGTYTLDITNLLNGCTSSSSTTVLEDISLPSINLTGGILTCLLDSVELDLITNAGLATYLWSGPNGFSSTEQNPTVDVAGTYQVTVTNSATGCTNTSSTVVTINLNLPTISLTGGTLSCLLDDVQLNLVTNAGLATYLWTGPNGFSSTQQNPTVSAAGTYEVTVTNTLTGCTNTESTIVDADLDLPSISLTGGTLSCLLDDIQLNLVTNAGLATYLWSGPNGYSSTQQNPTVSVAGTYEVIVTNTLTGCTNTESIIVDADLDLPSIDVTGGILSCLLNSLQLDLTTNVGLATYLWSGPNGFASTEQNPTVSVAGNYEVTVTNTLTGCTNTASVTVTADLDLPTISILGGELDCSGGSLQLDLTTNISLAAYVWAGPNGFSSTQQDPTVSVAGTYEVTVTNTATGCTAIGSIIVGGDANPPTVSVSGGQLTCSANTLQLNLTTNAAQATYLWAGPNGFSSTQQDPVVSMAGAYQVTVTNTATGCTATGSTTVTASVDLPTVSISGGNLSCTANSVQLVLTTNASAANYSWTGPNGFTSSQQNPTVSAAGTYQVTVTNTASGCSTIGSVNVSSDASLPTVSIATPGGLGCLATTVQLNANSSSQGPNFTYLWTTANGQITAGANTLTPTVSAAGNYNLLITNTSTGCTASASVTVQQASTLVLAAGTVQNSDCNNAPNGSATVNVNGGTQPYLYLWSNGQTTATASGLAAGSYSVVVTDANGCTQSISITIQGGSDTQPPTLNCTQNVLVACGGTPFVFSVPSASDNCSGSGDLTISQIEGLPSGTIFPDCPHVLTFRAIDEAGNSATCTMLVVVVDAPTVTIDQVTDDNNGTGQGSISVTAGCTGQVTYAWKGPNGFTANTEDISGLFAGTYSLVVTNAAGCTVSLTVVVQNLIGTDEPDRNIIVQVSPNPATSSVRLVITDDVELMSGKIMDTKGRLVQEITESDLTDEISVKKLVPGVFFMYLLSAENTQHVVKFVKSE